MVPSFHPDLLRGVSTCWWELFKAVPQLDVVYVPIGHRTKIVGVVSLHATTYADSLAADQAALDIMLPTSTTSSR